MMNHMTRSTILRSTRLVGAAGLLTALLLVLTGCPGGGTPTGPRLVFSDLNAALLSISGTSDTNVYAVGADPDDGRGPYVLHYNGSIWRRLNTGAGGDLWWISETPVDGDFFLSGTGGKVLTLDDATNQFSQLETPGGDDDTVFGVWGADGQHVWAVGGDLEDPDGSGFLWFYDGSQWTDIDLSAVLPQGVPVLYKVWGRSANDLYAVGRLGTILHFDGTTWRLVPSNTSRTLFTIHGNASVVVAVGGFIDAVIVERDGDEFVNRAPASLAQVNGVFIPSSGIGSTVGIEGTYARRGDNGWVGDSDAYDTSRDFHATWIDPDGGVWAVGGNLSAALDSGMIGYDGDATIRTTVEP